MPIMLDKDTYANEYKLLAKCCKFSFWSFCETFWDEIPGTGELIENWHMKYLCDVLQETAERIFRGETKKHDVLINISPGTSKPVWEGMPVMMADGTYKKLKNVKKGDYVIGKSGKPCKVLEVHKQGNLPCLKFITASRRTLITALDHPILTSNGWKKAKDIKTEDLLALMHKPQIESSSSHSIAEFTVAGYLIGDGSVSGGNCSLTNKDPDYIDDFCKACTELNFDYYIRKTKNGVTLISLSTPSGKNHEDGPRKWIEKIGLKGKTSKTKKIPDFVWKGTNAQIKAFLAAYFHCDGCVSYKHGNKRNISISACTISKKLALGLQRFFLRLGIDMRVQEHIVKNGFSYNTNLKNYKYYTVVTTNQDVACRFLEVIPLKGRKLDKLKGFNPKKRTFEQTYWPDEVLSIETLKTKLPCRCLTVEDDNSFVVNGIVVHNSSLGSILYPAWIWSRMPEARIITASHTDDLVLDLSNKSRFVIKSDLYQACFPEVQIRDDQDTKGYYANSAGGDRKTCTVGGKSPMGFHAHFCFPYETKITTKLGQIPIGEIVENKIQTDVLSCNHNINQFEWKPILKFLTNPEIQKSDLLYFSDGTSLSCTSNHPIFIEGKGYIPSESLKLGDTLLSYKEEIPQLKDFKQLVGRAYCSQSRKVYNLEIAENNNYFAENILVHNCIVDDPLDPKRAVSETELKSASYFYDSVIPSRKVNKEVSVEITIMQRLHLNDPSGHILERSKKDKTSKIFHISLPAELHEEGGKYSPENVIPVELVKNYKNGLMDPKRLSRNVLERERATMGIYSYSSQFLQNPIPLSGGMFHDHYFSQRVKAAPYACKRIRFWDRASSTDKGACNTAGVLMARDKDGNFYVEHVVVGKWEPKERNQKMRATALRDRAKYGKYEPVIWVEAEGGSAGRDAWKGIMRDLSGFVVKEDRVSGSKETRAEPWSAQLAGNAVWLVEDGTWDLNEYIQEHCHFPFGKLNDRVDSSCLIAGTSITTKTGEKLIEEVVVGDSVLTRKGFQKVLWSGKTKEVNFLVSVDFGNDIRITGTPEHLIWTEDRGFCRLDSLSATSRILYKEKTSCQNLKSLSILTESNSQKEEITIGEKGENYHCIEQHGNFITEKSPQSMTYIIKMETEIIILSKILNVCRKKNTCNDTLIVIKHQNNVNICNEFVNWLFNGINQKKEENGIGKTVPNVSKNENIKNTNVLFAILNLNPSVMGESLQRQREIDSVPDFVMSDIDTLQEKGLLTKNALCAVNRIREIEEEKPVPENVADYGVGRVPVYDLTVENEPEFFANGVLVHNSGAFNRLVGSPMVYPTLRTYTFSHNIKKNKNPRILVCSKDYLQNTIIDNSHRCLLVLLHEPEPVGNISDIPLHAIANLEGQIALQFSSHDPALHQDNWEELIAPFDRPVSDLMMFPSHGKTLWSFLLKKRQNIPDMWVFCDMQEKRKDISIALGILDLLRWDKGTSLECEYEEYQKNEHVYDIIKNSRNSVI